MKFFVSNKDESVRMFRSQFLESFSHIPPILPFVIYVPVVLFFLTMGFLKLSVIETFLSFLGGILIWTFVEYALHRFAFHYRATSKIGQRVHFILHGVHHDYPRDSTRLVMAPAVSIPLGVLFYFLFVFLFGVYAHAAYAGIVFGYLCYDGIHFSVHHFPMRSPILAFLKEYHLRHHYQQPSACFGVSSPLWDYILRTHPVRSKIEAEMGS